MKKTKIICSIGPACASVPIMNLMVEEGMNVARINFSHATAEEIENVLDVVKQVRKNTNQQIAILFDTKGPDFRTGVLGNDYIDLVEGKTIRIVKDDIIGTNEEISVNHSEIIDCLEVGHIILLEDGLMKLEVISKNNNALECKIINGGRLGHRKGINVPGVSLNIPFISEQDNKDIRTACRNNGDILALSFVNSKENIMAAREIIKSEKREDMLVISKIESQKALDNIDEILEVSDGIMVARGDLGVEIPMCELPIIQKKLVKKCREYGKICIVATEMLASMYTNARPTRAEATDIANAVLDGTDAVMLSGETTIGKHPIEAVQYMASICEYAETHSDCRNKYIMDHDASIAEAIAKSAIISSRVVDAKAIVTYTITGTTTRLVSNFRPEPPIVAACTTEEVARSLTLNFGVYPIVVNYEVTTDEIVNSAKQKVAKFLNLAKGDKLIITGGFYPSRSDKATNFMKIEKI